MHQHIAGLPFDALEKLGLFEEQAGSLKEKQRKTIGLVYDTIRKVNQEVGSLISEQFAALEDHLFHGGGAVLDGFLNHVLEQFCSFNGFLHFLSDLLMKSFIAM